MPIVEPEVLMDGDHTMERCEEVTATLLKLVFRELAGHRGQSTQAGRLSGRRDSNPRPSRWQRDALPLRYFRERRHYTERSARIVR